MTTASEERQEAVQTAAEPSPEPLRRQARTGASSVTQAAPAALSAVTERVQKAKPMAARAVALLDRPGSLVHAQPPTFRQARDRHHECASHFEALLLKIPRYAWGYFHLLIIMPALYLIVWVTESPARFFVTAAIVAIIWYFS